MCARLLLSSLFALLVASSATAQEWPRFRGLNGSGVSTSILPTRWTDKDYRWQVKLPGPGHSSPVLWGDRLFVTSAGEPGKLHALCLDAASGRILWNREVPAGPPRGHKNNNLASVTPAVNAKHVFMRPLRSSVAQHFSMRR